MTEAKVRPHVSATHATFQRFVTDPVTGVVEIAEVTVWLGEVWGPTLGEVVIRLDGATEAAIQRLG